MVQCRCSRRCLQRAIRAVNFIVNLLGVAMIIYSLWLLKKWKKGVSELVSPSSFPEPWFIYTCLGVGMVVCFGTLVGCMVSNYISNSTLLLYVVSICCLLLIQAVIIVSVFFKINWPLRLTKYIDESHKEFKDFVLFHVLMCRLISISVFMAQISIVLLAVILWAIGGESNHRYGSSLAPNCANSFLTLSFLDDHNTPWLDDSRSPERIFTGIIGEMLRRSFYQNSRSQN